MPIPCPVPDSDHEPVPEGSNEVETLFNLLYHLRDEDLPFLEQRCKDLLGVLQVGVPSPTEGV